MDNGYREEVMKARVTVTSKKELGIRSEGMGVEK